MPLIRKGKVKPARDPSDPDEFRATLIEHLEELRDRIIRSLILIGVCWVIGWYLEPWLYTHLNGMITTAIVKRLGPTVDYKTVFHNATEMFMLKIRLSFLTGIGLAFPFVIVQLGGFVSPGLKHNERKAVKSVIPASVVLFFMGVGFCWLIIPSAMTWFVSYIEEFSGTSLYQEAGSMVFLVLKMLLAFGVGFQLPLVVYVLGKIGLLSPDTLLKNWRQATVVIFVLSMIITPSNDLFSMLMMAIPLSLLFIASVYAVKYSAGKALSQADEEELTGEEDAE